MLDLSLVRLSRFRRMGLTFMSNLNELGLISNMVFRPKQTSNKKKKIIHFSYQEREKKTNSRSPMTIQS